MSTPTCRQALQRLLVFHQEGEYGDPLPREHWTPGYRQAVEHAEQALAAADAEPSNLLDADRIDAIDRAQ